MVIIDLAETTSLPDREIGAEIGWVRGVRRLSFTSVGECRSCRIMSANFNPRVKIVSVASTPIDSQVL